MPVDVLVFPAEEKDLRRKRPDEKKYFHMVLLFYFNFPFSGAGMGVHFFGH